MCSGRLSVYRRVPVRCRWRPPNKTNDEQTFPTRNGLTGSTGAGTCHDGWAAEAMKPPLVAAGVIRALNKDVRRRSRYATSRRERLHQLRHYYASVMLAGGVSAKELAEYLGHAVPGFTLRVYAHMMPGFHDRAGQAVDDRLFRPRTASRR
ncbi:tyrosine-type recombinase/integrase [Nonomuraea sp. ZG12]|uniref:tyrosine-type recombinase/integrase n=1 Tax=Nonomuraea sp. ZG12 TaxID=3452207 RepID=UPI003F8A3865